MEAIHKIWSNICKRVNTYVKQNIVTDDDVCIIVDGDLHVLIKNLKSYNDIIETNEDDDDGNNDKNSNFSDSMTLYQCCVNDLVRRCHYKESANKAVLSLSHSSYLLVMSL